jgi:hypothetical protein
VVVLVPVLQQKKKKPKLVLVLTFVFWVLGPRLLLHRPHHRHFVEQERTWLGVLDLS